MNCFPAFIEVAFVEVHHWFVSPFLSGGCNWGWWHISWFNVHLILWKSLFELRCCVNQACKATGLVPDWKTQHSIAHCFLKQDSIGAFWGLLQVQWHLVWSLPSYFWVHPWRWGIICPVQCSWWNQSWTRVLHPWCYKPRLIRQLLWCLAQECLFESLFGCIVVLLRSLSCLPLQECWINCWIWLLGFGCLHLV